MPSSRNLRNDLLVVILLAVIVFLIAALVTRDPADDLSAAPEWLQRVFPPDRMVYPPNLQVRNACGFWGAWVAEWLFNGLGYGVYFVVAGLVSWELALVKGRTAGVMWLRAAGWGLGLLGVTTLLAYLMPVHSLAPLIGSGGYLGALAKGLLSLQVAQTGGLIISLTVTLVGLMLWTEYLIFRAGRLMFAPAFLAAARWLPFGLLLAAMQGWNRMGRKAKPRSGLAAAQSADGETESDGLNIDGTDLPRTIRINQGGSDEFQPNRIILRDRTSLPDNRLAAESIPTSLPAGKAPLAATDTEELDDSIADEFEDSEDELDLDAGPEPIEPEASGVHTKPHFALQAPPNSIAKVPTEREVVIRQLNAAASSEGPAEYELPRLELLLKSDSVCFDDQKREALQKADMLEKTCKEFGYSVRVVEIETGPVISQYEIQLEAGLRLQKITALADDLAIALRVPSVRIVAPIPGKNTVGVEVPNEARQIVRLREVIEQSEAKTRKMKIPLFLGKDAVGAPMVVDLATLPHLLIAGRTGTGKSVCLNAIITSILMTRRPDEVRMLMIDPKMVELSGYARLPHLMHPVVTDMRKAEAILAWAVEKMEERYALLARAGVRHISSYNQLGEEELIDRLAPESDDERENIPLNLPFIVIVADEMADLMMTCGKEVEQHIIRLAQKSRAVGIHLILATQKPTVDVITGLIKSNLPARIAFQVASKMDSRVVLDAMGADKLLGNGDMLFLWPGTSTLLRGQGTYLTDEEIESVTEAVSTGEQNFVHELMQIKVQKPEGEQGGGLPNRDEMYEQAVDVVIREGRGSVSLLQRALGIGYGRAARLIDFMETDGIVGTYNGSKSREVIMSLDQWQTLQAGARQSPELPESGTIELAPTAGRISRLAASQSSPHTPSRTPKPRIAVAPSEDSVFESESDEETEARHHDDDVEEGDFDDDEEQEFDFGDEADDAPEEDSDEDAEDFDD